MQSMTDQLWRLEVQRNAYLFNNPGAKTTPLDGIIQRLKPERKPRRDSLKNKPCETCFFDGRKFTVQRIASVIGFRVSPA